MLLGIVVVIGLLASPPAPTCPGSGRSLTRETLHQLDKIEREEGVPVERRGVLAAIWCVEGMWSPGGVALYGDGGRALGPFQFHIPAIMPCLPADYAGHDPRMELEFSARCWLRRVRDMLPRAEAACGPVRAWDHAEALVSAPGRYGHECSKSKHVILLERWRMRWHSSSR